jgi:putative PEP-CTERM system TPR-repeat lipoprotein
MPIARISPINWFQRFMLVVCFLAVAACGDSTTSEEYLARAEQLLAEHNYAEAIIELKNALSVANEKQQTLPRARWLLGKVYLDTGSATAAAKELERARELGWNPNEVLPALAKALLSKGDLTGVMALSTAGLSPQATAQLQAQQALAKLGQGDIWTADTFIAKASEVHGEDPEVQLAEVRMLGASGDLDGALALVERVLAEHPDRRDAWSMKGDLLAAQNKRPEALAAFSVAIELSPDSKEDRLKRGLLNLEMRQLEDVTPDIEFLLETAPKHPMTNYLQGSLDFLNGNYANCIDALTLAEPAAEQYPLILFYLSGAYMVEGNEAEAVRQSERQVTLNPNFAPGRILLASLYLKNARAKEAQQTLRPVLDADPSDRLALNIMAKALIQDGKTDQALKILKTLQQTAPESAIAHFELGAGLLFDGQREAANRQFETALSLDPSLEQASMFRLQAISESEDIAGAIADAQEYVKQNPDSVHGHTVLGQKYLANEQVDEAIAELKEALSLVPGDPEANHTLAKIEQQRGNTEASRAYYQAVLKERPDYLPTLLHLAALAAEPGNEDEMVAQLEYAIEAHPDALEPRLMLARYYVWGNMPDKIPPLFASLSELQQQSPEVLSLLAISQIAEFKYDKAQYNLEQLVELEQDTAYTHHLLARAAAGAGDLERAREELKRAEEIDENFAPALVSLARLAWADGNASQFDNYMGRLSKLAPESPDVLRLHALAAQRDGDSEQVTALFRKILEAAPTTESMLELAGYLYVTGEKQESRQIVENWVSTNPDDVAARMALATQLVSAGHIEDALDQYREVIRIQPENAAALNNLAWYLRDEDPVASLKYARLAVAAAPDKVEILDTVAIVESQAGNHREALRHIQRALELSPDDPNLLYHQAEIEARSGNKGAAIVILNKVLGGDSPVFQHRVEAEELLASLQ